MGKVAAGRLSADERSSRDPFVRVRGPDLRSVLLELCWYLCRWANCSGVIHVHCTFLSLVGELGVLVLSGFRLLSGISAELLALSDIPFIPLAIPQEVAALALVSPPGRCFPNCSG